MSGIVQVIRFYYPWFEEPTWDSWSKVCCPFHGESNASATINTELGKFHCFVCEAKGDAIDIIQYKEKELSYPDARKRLQEILGDSGEAVRSKPKRVSRRRVFGETRH